VFNEASIPPQALITSVQQGLIIVRAAMGVASDMYAWSSGVSLADLEGLGPAGTGIPAADAGQILSAIKDAYALSCFYNTGLPPSGYPQPPSAYRHRASAQVRRSSCGGQRHWRPGGSRSWRRTC
jgi:hypothetical protein